MILLGTAVVQGSGLITLPAPGGFNDLQAVRISNYGTLPVIVQNVHSTSQDQEYLPPGQQMVYRAPNVSAIPTIVPAGVSGTAATTPAAAAASLLVEWCTDAENDFPGIYPASVSRPTSSAGAPGSSAAVPAFTVPAAGQNQVQTFRTGPTANSPVVVTMPAVAGVTAYLTGLEISVGGATAGAIIDCFITGVAGSAPHYGVAVPTGVTLLDRVIVEFTTPLAASAPNTAIVLNVPAAGAGNTHQVGNIHGFYQ